MKLGMLLNEDELINNFTFAEAVFAECKRTDLDLDAETIAKMILLQVGLEKGGK